MLSGNFSMLCFKEILDDLAYFGAIEGNNLAASKGLAGCDVGIERFQYNRQGKWSCNAINECCSDI